MIVVMLGPPGTGKGTVSQYLKGKKSFLHISTGDLIRAEIKAGSELGNKIKGIVSEGKLVSDDIVAELLKKAITSTQSKNIVLDGFPRTLGQAKMLDIMLNGIKKKLDLVIDLESGDELIVRRLSARKTCPKCNQIYGMDVLPKKAGICDRDGTPLIQRQDDREEVVRQRLKVYRELTEPLIGYYKKKSLLKEVDGNLKLEEIYNNIDKLI